jgi:hypothetical protein
MKKYIQKVIPEVSTKDIPADKFLQRKFAKEYYHDNFQGKIVVINQDKGISIQFIGEGKKKSSYGAAMYTKKAAVIKILDQLLTFAQYSNWGERKESDNDYVIGYLNFKAKVKIDKEICHFTLNVQVRKDGKFQYSLDENRLQIKNPPK